MSPATKLALRRFALRWLRKLVDVADDRLHAAEVSFRKQQEVRNAALDQCYGAVGVSDLPVSTPLPRQKETFLEWEARRSGVAPVSKKAARQRRERQGAAAFDLRFAR